MATKPKAAKESADEDDTEKDGDAQAKDEARKTIGLAGRFLAPLAFLTRFLGFLNPLTLLKLPRKRQLIVVPVVLVAIAGIGAGTYFLMFSGTKPADAAGAQADVQTQSPPLPAAQATFFDIPDIIVNIQTADSTPAYLKLSVALELDKIDVNTTIEPVLPRIIDQFQTYLRELRVDDIKGSAGVMRLKEELLRRVNLAVAPTPVRDVLLKEMIVQ